jgi:CDP-diacylglycerol--glycerol-3-phosphate 3-phosphatidyltransferase
VNLPNYITLSRIASVPLIMWVLTTHRFDATKDNTLRVCLASGIFILASITDGLDGYLARRRKQITTMGMLLDPLADKLMIAAAYITLVRLIPDVVSVWVAVIIVGREFLISGLRSIAASEGFTIEASELGKLKMVIQIVSVVAAILAMRWNEWVFFPNSFPIVLPVRLVAIMAIWFMVAVSIISAIDYFIGFWKKIDKRVERRRRRPFILSRKKKKALEAEAAAAQTAQAENPVKAN